MREQRNRPTYIVRTRPCILQILPAPAPAHTMSAPSTATRSVSVPREEKPAANDSKPTTSTPRWLLQALLPVLPALLLFALLLVPSGFDADRPSSPHSSSTTSAASSSMPMVTIQPRRSGASAAPLPPPTGCQSPDLPPLGVVCNSLSPLMGMYELLSAAESWCSLRNEEMAEFGAPPEWPPLPQVNQRDRWVWVYRPHCKRPLPPPPAAKRWTQRLTHAVAVENVRAKDGWLLGHADCVDIFRSVILQCAIRLPAEHVQTRGGWYTTREGTVSVVPIVAAA